MFAQIGGRILRRVAPQNDTARTGEFCTLHSALCTLHSALCVLHFALCILNFALLRSPLLSEKRRVQNPSVLCVF